MPDRQLAGITGMNIITAGLTLTAVAAIAFGLAGYLSARYGAESPRAAAERGIVELEELLDLESRTW